MLIMLGNLSKLIQKVAGWLKLSQFGQLLSLYSHMIHACFKRIFILTRLTLQSSCNRKAFWRHL
uniref:AW257883 n=1 Tax=Arundo donax TaxID=35708 RepID=A0A0A9AML5_ARUDO